MFKNYSRVGAVCLFLLIFLASCDADPVSLKVTPVVVEKGDTARRTLLVYMMAENSLANYASLDIAEIEEAVASVPEDCRLFVYNDDRSFPTLCHYFSLSNGETGNSVFHPFAHDVCSSDTATLGALFDYILKDYPTEKLDVVLWSHGDGWLRAPLGMPPQRSIGIDNGDNSYSNNVAGAIEMEELAALLKRLPAKVDRVLFDACFMQCAESAYALRNSAEWIIASPAEIPGDGALYSAVLPEFFQSDGPERIIDAYVRGYENEPAGAVLSAVHAPSMQHLADVTYSYVNKYFNKDKKRDYIDVFSYLPGGKYTGDKTYTAYYDMNAVMVKYLSPGEYEAWHSAFTSAVAYVAASKCWYSAIRGRAIAFDAVKGGGLSMYMPQRYSSHSQFNADFSTTEWYSAAGWDAAGW